MGSTKKILVSNNRFYKQQLEGHTNFQVVCQCEFCLFQEPWIQLMIDRTVATHIIISGGA